MTTSSFSNHADRLRSEIARRPRDFALYLDLARTLETGGDIVGAMTVLQTATAQRGAPPAIWCALAGLARRRGDVSAARAIIDESLTRHPASLEMYAEQVALLQNDPEATLDVYRRAAAACGESSALLHNMGCAYQALDRPAEAERCYRRALAKNEMILESWNNLGLMLCEQSRFDEALKVWAQGLSRGGGAPVRSLAPGAQPDPRAQIRWHRAMAWLLLEDFAHGWLEYEWRFAGSGESAPLLPLRRWTGEPVSGRRILVIGEQGIGDEILFASFLPVLATRGASIVLACAPRLVPLFRRAWPGFEIHGHDCRSGTPLPFLCTQVDLQVPIGSLPGLLSKDTAHSFPGAPFLHADADGTRRWKTRHGALGPGIKVGLSWRGGTARTIARRSLPAVALARLGSVPGVRFVDVQYGSTASERSELARIGIQLAHFDDTDPLRDMDEFASQLAALDLLISVDNSSVHLAGALGVPTWVLQHKVPEWRWGTGRTDCRWYASVRQFRQTERGNWADVIREVADALATVTPAGGAYKLGSG